MNVLPLEINPLQVKDLLATPDAGTGVRLIDVREPFEFQICSIAGAELIPMQSVPAKVADLDSGEGLMVIICHHGVRSLSVVDWLRRQGVENCQSMAGGIDRWSREVDSAVARY